MQRPRHKIEKPKNPPETKLFSLASSGFLNVRERTPDDMVRGTVRSEEVSANHFPVSGEFSGTGL